MGIRILESSRAPKSLTPRHNPDAVNVPHPTRAGTKEKRELPKAGLMLQDYGNPVQYRNIWILPINGPQNR